MSLRWSVNTDPALYHSAKQDPGLIKMNVNIILTWHTDCLNLYPVHQTVWILGTFYTSVKQQQETCLKKYWNNKHILYTCNFFLCHRSKFVIRHAHLLDISHDLCKGGLMHLEKQLAQIRLHSPTNLILAQTFCYWWSLCMSMDPFILWFSCLLYKTDFIHH